VGRTEPGVPGRMDTTGRRFSVAWVKEGGEIVGFPLLLEKEESERVA